MITQEELEKYRPTLTGQTLLYFTLVFVLLGVFLFGFDQGVMSGVLSLPTFNAYFNHPSRAEIAIMVAILELGAFVSSLFVGRIGDVIGRRRAIRYGAMVFVVGGAIQTFARRMPDLIFGRVISGLGVGVLSAIVPVYQSEVSAPTNRGRMGCVQFTGNIMGYMSLIWVDYGSSLLEGNISWRLPLSVQCIMGLMLVIGSYIIVETPRWLLLADKDVEGLIVIANLHLKGNTDARAAKEEYQAIKRDVLSHRLDGETKGYRYMWRRYKKRVIIGCLCLILAQFNGINVICYYAALVFEQAGWHGRKAVLMTGINAVIYMFSTIIPWFIVDRHGRRPILLTGAAIMFFALVGMAAAIKIDSEHTPLVMVILVIIYTGPGFGTSWGPLAWFIPSEVLPVSVRLLGASCATSSNWVANFIVGEMTPILQELIGWRLYLLHAGLCLVSFIFVYRFLPETAGVSLEDMNAVFGDGGENLVYSYAQISDSELMLGSAHESDRLFDENLYYGNHDDESLAGARSFTSAAQMLREPGKPNLDLQFGINRPLSASMIMPEDTEPPSLEEVLRFKQKQAETASILGLIRKGSESMSQIIGKVFKRGGEQDDDNHLRVFLDEE